MTGAGHPGTNHYESHVAVIRVLEPLLNDSGCGLPRGGATWEASPAPQTVP